MEFGKEINGWVYSGDFLEYKVFERNEDMAMLFDGYVMFNLACVDNEISCLKAEGGIELLEEF